MRRRACQPPRLIPAPPTLPPQQAAGLEAADAPGRRVLALALPDFATDRLRRAQDPPPADRPLATWAAEGSARILVAVDRIAAGRGLVPGMGVADAQARHPDLVLSPAAPAAEAALLRRLADGARCFTPLVAADPPDGLLLDVTGASHLWGGDIALLAQAVARLRRAGFAAQGAIAPTPQAAMALARTSPGTIIGPEHLAGAVARLPVAAFRPGAAVLATLHRFGLLRAGDVLARPRGPLVRRLGPRLLATLDAALGIIATPITPVAPDPPALAARDFLEPISTPEAIGAALDRLLHTLCRGLAETGRGARRLQLTLHRVDDSAQHLTIAAGQAGRAPAHFRRLFAERMDRIEPRFGIARMELEALAPEPLGAAQSGLPGSAAAEGDRAAALGLLLDRLAHRLGPAKVFALAPVADHEPDRAVCPADPQAPRAPPPPGWAARPRPVRLWSRPVPTDVVAAVPDGPPASLRWRGQARRIVRAIGPERIASAWWRDAHAEATDFWRIETQDGTRLWLAHQGRAWTVRGPMG